MQKEGIMHLLKELEKLNHSLSTNSAAAINVTTNTTQNTSDAKWCYHRDKTKTKSQTNHGVPNINDSYFAFFSNFLPENWNQVKIK